MHKHRDASSTAVVVNQKLGFLPRTEGITDMSEYAKYFKQQLLSDCDLVISWPKDDDCWFLDCLFEADFDERIKDANMHRASTRFPAHQLILFKCSHFEAQGKRWQLASGSMPSQATSNQTGCPAVVMPQKEALELSIYSAEQLPAAEAVIAALYGVENCFNDLSHDQLVHALVIADMIDLPGMVEQIIEALKSVAISSTAGLSSAALQAMANLPAWPDCMYQLLPSILGQFTDLKGSDVSVKDLQAVQAADTDGLIQRVLLAAFGDLQAVWRNSAVSQILMQLPLAAIQLLLSSDKLGVPSEDVVLYTAQQHLTAQLSGLDGTFSSKILRMDSIRAALAALVRAPYLSDTVLHSVALSTDGSSLFKDPAQLRQLIMLRRITDGAPTETDLRAISKAPECWLQGPRQLVPEQETVVVWTIPVAQVITACKKACVQSNCERIRGPESPPLGAVSWKPHLACEPGETGVLVGLYVGPSTYMFGVFYKFQYSLTLNDGPPRTVTSSILGGNQSWGWSDYFGTGPMAGGWDEAAWAAEGLPTTGDLVVNLKMLKVW